MIKELDEKSFRDFIAKGNVIIDFHAEWCGPCKMMDPHFKKAAETLKGIKFGKVDIDGQQDIAGQFDVMSIPTTIYFKDGEVVERHTGAMDFTSIKKLADEAF
jgi:thioredoxin 1